MPEEIVKKLKDLSEEIDQLIAESRHGDPTAKVNKDEAIRIYLSVRKNIQASIAELLRLT